MYFKYSLTTEKRKLPHVTFIRSELGTFVRPFVSHVLLTCYVDDPPYHLMQKVELAPSGLRIRSDIDRIRIQPLRTNRIRIHAKTPDSTESGSATLAGTCAHVMS